MHKNTIITAVVLPLIGLTAYALHSSHTERRTHEAVLQERSNTYAREGEGTELFLREEFVRIHEGALSAREQVSQTAAEPNASGARWVIATSVGTEAGTEALREAAVRRERERIQQEEAEVEGVARLLEQLRVAQVEAEALAKEESARATTVTKSSRTSSAS